MICVVCVSFCNCKSVLTILQKTYAHKPSTHITYQYRCGKSTFLRILAEACGNLSGKARDNVPYSGEVECPKDVTVAFVEQEPPSPSDIRVSDALLGVTEINNNNSGSSSSSNSINAVYETVRKYRLASLNAATNPEEFANAATQMDNTMDGRY